MYPSYLGGVSLQLEKITEGRCKRYRCCIATWLYYHSDRREVRVCGNAFCCETAENITDADGLRETGHAQWGWGNHLTEHEVRCGQASNHLPVVKKIRNHNSVQCEWHGMRLCYIHTCTYTVYNLPLYPLMCFKSSHFHAL